MRRISPREAKRMMQRMGMEIEEMPGITKVTLAMKDKNLIIVEPQVTVMKVGGQKVYQIIGEAIEEKLGEAKLEISDEDAQLVAAQTGASLEAARKALESTKGDLAQAIMLLTVKG